MRKRKTPSGFSPPLLRPCSGCIPSVFLVAADHQGVAYRYHALFAEFLVNQLERGLPGEVAELHRRAAEAQATPAGLSHNTWPLAHGSKRRTP